MESHQTPLQLSAAEAATDCGFAQHQAEGASARLAPGAAAECAAEGCAASQGAECAAGPCWLTNEGSTGSILSSQDGHQKRRQKSAQGLWPHRAPAAEAGDGGDSAVTWAQLCPEDFCPAVGARSGADKGERRLEAS